MSDSGVRQETVTERLPTLYQLGIIASYLLGAKLLFDFAFGTVATQLNAYLCVAYLLLVAVANLDRARREGVGVFG